MRGATPRARFAPDASLRAGGAVVGLLVLFAIAGAWASGHEPNASDFVSGRLADGSPAPPGAAHWLGTDVLFRDQLARLACGARLSLAIASAASLLSLGIGATVGVVAGWYEGKPFSVAGVRVSVDDLLMRLVDVGLAFPFLLLVMAIGALLDRSSVGTLLVVLGLTGWLGTARIVRAKTMQVRERDFVLAARALGQTTPAILVRHILPNVAGALLVIGTVSVAQMILAESVLSYLAVGVQPPTATWGRMLAEGQAYYTAAPWLVVEPGAAILASVLGFHLLGEGLRRAWEPRER